ncbi:MAG TPA: hypothetical protein VEJ44_06915 [Acidimicrobiales bacterium]|nr:hypothetical protein [Acidimicrobiales bacterium]
MASGSFLRSVHSRLFVDPVRRVVHNEVTEVTERLADTVADNDRELRRTLQDLADAGDQVAEAIGRSLVRLSAEIEALQDELTRLKEASGTGEPPTGR